MSGRIDRYTVKKMYHVGKYDEEDFHMTNIITLEDMVSFRIGPQFYKMNYSLVGWCRQLSNNIR